MVAMLKKQGVTHIKGNLVIYTSVFASHDMAPGWPWNDLTQCFSTPPGAAIVDKNFFSVSLYSATTPGETAFVLMPLIILPICSARYAPSAATAAKDSIASWMSCQAS